MVQDSTFKIYRSILETESPTDLDAPLFTDQNVRPPVNTPNVVDNLWEWMRPAAFPSRRYSAFASPSRRLAKQHGPQTGRVYRVEFAGKYRICQLRGYRNSRDHPENWLLPIFLYDQLGTQWLASNLTDKIDVGRLWLPCIGKSDVDSLFDEVAALSQMRDEVRERTRYWQYVRLLDPANPVIDDDGELFFEAEGGYFLRPDG